MDDPHSSDIDNFFTNGMFDGQAGDYSYDKQSTFHWDNSSPPPISGVLGQEGLEPDKMPCEVPAFINGDLSPRAGPSEVGIGKGKTIERTIMLLPEEFVDPGNSPMTLDDQSMLALSSTEAAFSSDAQNGPSTLITTNGELGFGTQAQAHDNYGPRFELEQRLTLLEKENRNLTVNLMNLQTTVANLTQGLRNRIDPFCAEQMPYFNQRAQNQVNAPRQHGLMHQSFSTQSSGPRSGMNRQSLAPNTNQLPQLPPTVPSMRPPQTHLHTPAPKRRKVTENASSPGGTLSPNAMALNLSTLATTAVHQSPGPTSAPQRSASGMPACSPEVFKQFQQLTELIKEKQTLSTQCDSTLPTLFDLQFRDLWNKVRPEDWTAIRNIIMLHNHSPANASPSASGAFPNGTPAATSSPSGLATNTTPQSSGPSTDAANFVGQMDNENNELMQHSPMQQQSFIEPSAIQNDYMPQAQYQGNSQQRQNNAPVAQMFSPSYGQRQTFSPQNTGSSNTGHQAYQSQSQSHHMPQQQLANAYLSMQGQHFNEQTAIDQQMGSKLGEQQGQDATAIQAQQNNGNPIPGPPHWFNGSPIITLLSPEEINSVLTVPLQNSPQILQQSMVPRPAGLKAPRPANGRGGNVTRRRR